jgi:hypothetical protein
MSINLLTINILLRQNPRISQVSAVKFNIVEAFVERPYRLGKLLPPSHFFISIL